MPKYNNQFTSLDHIEQMIQDEKGSVVGTIRLKPSSVLWKSRSARKFHSVSLQKFIDWITDPNTKARMTKS